ncbi:MAG: hypothetical protein COA63_012265 [Methylophaga sp.]|nr:hypothetical protein [Methylophaga sp.]
MKLFKTQTIAISSAILLGLVSLTASAGSLTLGYSSGGHHNQHHSYGYGHHYSSKQYNYGYGYGHRKSYAYQQYRAPHYQQRKHNNYNNHSTYTKPCHQVSKMVVDDYGQYQKVGGTMCYDSYGQGYVVSGSRYQIR